jgi:hypothetical protein
MNSLTFYTHWQNTPKPIKRFIQGTSLSFLTSLALAIIGTALLSLYSNGIMHFVGLGSLGFSITTAALPFVVGLSLCVCAKYAKRQEFHQLQREEKKQREEEAEAKRKADEEAKNAAIPEQSLVDQNRAGLQAKKNNLIRTLTQLGCTPLQNAEPFQCRNYYYAPGNAQPQERVYLENATFCHKRGNTLTYTPAAQKSPLRLIKGDIMYEDNATTRHVIFRDYADIYYFSIPNYTQADTQTIFESLANYLQ